MDNPLSGLTAQERKLWRQAATFLKDGRPWDLIHTETCLGYAFEIADGERWPESLRRLVIPAVMLHDIGWALIPAEKRKGRAYSQEDSRVDHMRVGAQKARDLMREAGYPEREAETVSLMVGEHDNPYIGKPFANPYTRRLREIDILWSLMPMSFWKKVESTGERPQQALEMVFRRLEAENVFSASGRKIARRLRDVLDEGILAKEEGRAASEEMFA